jgi:cytochrome c-type biogenesis protein CcmE
MLAGVLLGGGFVVFQFLNNSTTYFCNADELGVKADCTGSRHIRLQGTVTPKSVQKGTPLKFTVTYGTATIPVTYEGDPGGVFCEGIPVVVEGIYKANMFQGDRILIKHTEQYRAANPERTAGDKDCGL